MLKSTFLWNIFCTQWHHSSTNPNDNFRKTFLLRSTFRQTFSFRKLLITIPTSFLEYLSSMVCPGDLNNLLESSEVVGNIRFSHPTLYVFPGGQGDSALFGINGFNMLGEFSSKWSQSLLNKLITFPLVIFQLTAVFREKLAFGISFVISID